MPSLPQTLPANDLGFLKIVASLWGVELVSAAPAEAAFGLAEAICDIELLEEIVSTLSDEAQTALGALIDEEGRLPWATFTRRFGEVREMGAAKRDREQPHLNPSSATELLWYRALLARAFFETDKGSQEFAFIPDDLREALELIGFEAAPDEAKLEEKPLAALPKAPPKQDVKKESAPQPAETFIDEPQYEDISEFEDASVEDDSPVQKQSFAKKNIPQPLRPQSTPENAAGPGRPATPGERTTITLANDHILDDATSLLAALRMEMDAPAGEIPSFVLVALLTGSRLIKKNQPQPEPVKNFLEMPRNQALQSLYNTWLNSHTFNELRQLTGLVFEGVWENDSFSTRHFLLEKIAELPKNQWWSIPAFIRDIKASQPDFQRPAGDYDTWFIKRLADGAYLRGFEHWDAIDGALIRYFFQVLNWLGQADLGSTTEGGPATAFRLTNGVVEIKDESAKMTVASNGRITIPRMAPRVMRYQAARFCEWESSPNPTEFRYRITSRSLQAASKQGLKPSHLLGLLAKQTSGQVPPVLVKALQRWELNGTEAKVEQLSVLKVKRPEVLEELRASKAGRFLGEIIGPVTVVIQSGAESKVMAALAEMGLLAEGDLLE